MLIHQIRKTEAKCFEGTVNPSNEALRRNYCELAQLLNTKCEEYVLFSEGDFENDSHEPEILYRIGLISKNEIKLVSMQLIATLSSSHHFHKI